MAESSLIIKIDAEIKGFQNQLKRIQDETKNLESGLKEISKVSGLAFAGLSGIIGVTIAAYKDQEKTTNQLNQALKSQGIYTKELSNYYRDIADVLQIKTGIDDDDIVKAQTKLQSYLGQTKITRELTEALLDYSVVTGTNVTQAAMQLGKAISGDVENLRAMKLNVSENLTQSQRLSAIIDQLNGRFYGQAAAAAAGLGQLNVLSKVVSDSAEIIGKKFSPYVESATRILISFFNSINKNDALMNNIALILGISTGLAGLAFVTSGAGLAFIQLRNGILGANIALEAIGLSISTLVKATGLGLIIATLGILAYNWRSTMAMMTTIFIDMANQISQAAKGIGNILAGIFTFDKEQITKGIGQIKALFTAEFDTFEQTLLEQKKRWQVVDLNNDLEHAENKRVFREEQHLAQLTEYEMWNAEFVELKRQFDEGIITEQGIRNLAALDVDRNQYNKENTIQLEAHKKFIENERLYGTTIATMDKILKSEQTARLQNTLETISTLQNAHDKRLVILGKAAATANIIVNTAVGISEAWKLGPILGPILAPLVALAGAVQLATVAGVQFAEGGIVDGPTYPVDSVPAMLTGGEMVLNRDQQTKLFDIANNGGGSNGGIATVILELKGELMDFIEAKLVERQNLSISIQGA